MKNYNLHRAVHYTLAAMAIAASSAAFAQTAPKPSDAGPVLEDVVITGSRLRTLNDVSISPVQSISANDIAAVGLSRVEDILNQMPSVFAGQNANVSNGADGTASVDLRGLGPSRTLVLVNGRRLGPGSTDGRNYSDIDQVPAALIQRVDVLTGGASSVYGADAVAGVVNFVLNNHFEGVQFDANYGTFMHKQSNNGIASIVKEAGDPLPSSNVTAGGQKDLSFIAGANFADGKGNATVYATYNTAAAVLQSKYDYSSCTLNAASGGAKPYCGGSITNKGGTFLGYYGSSYFFKTVDQQSGLVRDFGGNDYYNYGPLNYQQRPNQRWTAGAFLNYDINSHVNVYSEFMYMRNSTVAQVAPSGAFGLPVTLNCATNPFLQSATWQNSICSSDVRNGQAVPGDNVDLLLFRRNVEGGNRNTDFLNNSVRFLLGAKGSINDAWNYDVSAQESLVDTRNIDSNYLSNTRMTLALDVVGTVDSPVCASGAGCVPWNVFVPGGVTAAALKYLSVPLQQSGNVTEQIVSASLTGDLSKYGWQFPLAAHGVQANFGAEYRNEHMSYSPDLESQTLAPDGSGPDAAGYGAPAVPLTGGFHVAEVFTEWSLPIAENQRFAQSLSAEVGYRYSSYTTGFNTNTYKLGLEWSPIKDVRWRAGYQRAVRAPSIGDLYTSQVIALDGSSDPCAVDTPPATCPPNVRPNPAGQYQGLVGGNPDLKPETADTYTVGLQFMPHQIESLKLGVDYFDIKIKNVIGAIGSNVILNQCYVQGNQDFCSLVHRSPTGSLWTDPAAYVSDLAVNSGTSATAGVDFTGSYRLKMDRWGTLGFQVNATHLAKLEGQPYTGSASYNCAGYFGNTCGTSNPKWRSVVNTTWTTPWHGVDVNLRWRFFGSAAYDNTSSNPLMSGDYTPGYYTNIGSYSYLDLSSAFSVASGVTMRLGMNNLTDKNPPIVLTGNGCTPSCNGNTFPGAYDSLGRYVYAHMTVQF